MGYKRKMKELDERVKTIEESMEKQRTDSKQEKIKEWIWKIIPIIISVIAIYQVDKNYNIDYKPELRVNADTYGMTWNENGETLAVDEEVYQEVDRFVYNTNVDNPPIISMVNIASKPAKDIVITWEDEENVKTISEELRKGNSGTSVYLEEDLFVIQKNHEEKEYIQANTIQEINYLSGDLTQGERFVSLPGVYYDLIREIVRTNVDYKWEMSLKLKCICKDSMDKEHDYEIELAFSPNYCYGYNNEVIDGKMDVHWELKRL